MFYRRTNIDDFQLSNDEIDEKLSSGIEFVGQICIRCNKSANIPYCERWRCVCDKVNVTKHAIFEVFIAPDMGVTKKQLTDSKNRLYRKKVQEEIDREYMVETALGKQI